MVMEIVATAGVMAIVCAYILFKIKDSDNPVVSALQPLFFFMIMASFIIMGSASFQSSNDCYYLLDNYTFVGNTTFNSYSYTCELVAESAGSWSYRLPLWFGYLGSSYMLVYVLYLIYNFFKKKGGRDE